VKYYFFKVKRYPVVCLLFLSYSAVGQINLDSLWTVWNDTSKPDINRLNAIDKIAWYGYLDTQPDSAYYFAQLQYDFAKSKGVKKQMADALGTQGVSLQNRGDYASAIDYYTRSLTIREEIGDKQGTASSLNNIGSNYHEQGNYASAIDYYTRSLTIYEELENKKGIASSLGNIGLIYYEHGNSLFILHFFLNC